MLVKNSLFDRLFYHFHNAVARVTECMPGTSLQTYLPKISVSLFHVQHKGMLLACILAFFPHTRQTCSKQCTAIASSDMAYSDAYCTQQKRVSKYMTLLVYRSNLTFTAGTVIESWKTAVFPGLAVWLLDPHKIMHNTIVCTAAYIELFIMMHAHCMCILYSWVCTLK